jgi:hypothetical protein
LLPLNIPAKHYFFPYGRNAMAETSAGHINRLYLRIQRIYMKAKYFFIVLMTLCSTSLFAQTKTDTVKVWGVCDDCKDKIEKAAIKGGAVTADWNEDSYALVINYNSEKNSALNIEKEIAAVGYDTQDVKASDEAYNKLPKCCQYTRGSDANTGTKQE